MARSPEGSLERIQGPLELGVVEVTIPTLRELADAELGGRVLGQEPLERWLENLPRVLER